VIKHGLIGLTKYIATYWAENGVRCNAFAPGGVFNNHPDEFVKKVSDLIPMKRMANIDEYKASILFLCSDASSYMNGAILNMDGGRSVW
jgi:NAD(P)-dependent dehydrogenase (short-subunit alcohol dehydrogenase family)